MTLAASNLIPAVDYEVGGGDRGAGIMIRVKSPALRASWEPASQLSWDGWEDEEVIGGYFVPADMRERLRQWLLEIRVER